jgi:heat-inducible transcriptional repressor
MPISPEAHDSAEALAPAEAHDSTDMHNPVTLRRQQVLYIVVKEYTKTAQPVGSATIANNYGLGVSAATIRNDLAALEEEGLLTHPHTSAGRVPTEAGYRLFVQQILAKSGSELPAGEQETIRGEFNLARQEVDQWLRMSTAVLARASHNAALATAPRANRSRFKHLELVGIRDTKVLLVLVLQDGTVKQQLLDLDQPIDQGELSAISNELNDRLQSLTFGEIRTISELFHGRHGNQALLARQVALLAAEIMERIDTRVSGPIYRDGLTQILDAQEFVDNEHMHKIVRVFEQRSLLEQIVDEYMNEDGLQVVINGEGRIRELQDISLVLGSYGSTEHATGVLGVIGPVRMSYGRTIGAVRFVAALMSEMVEELYGY